MTARIDIDDLEVDMDYGQRLLYRGELFTGEAEERMGDVVVCVESYVDGLVDGPFRHWHLDGTLSSEGMARQGRAVGLCREWHPNGVLASERLFTDDGLRLLEDRSWDDDGRPTRNWRLDTWLAAGSPASPPPGTSAKAATLATRLPTPFLSTPPPPSSRQAPLTDPELRALGAVLGSAVGDALGAPFEFGPEGAFSARFPVAGLGGEMCGGGGWDPGEATDDTQMAVLVAESLVEHDGLDLPDVFRRFQRWAVSGPKDIGLQTEDVLTNGEPWDRAAAAHFEVNLRAAGNGALMRASTSAVYFARQGREATMDAGRRLSALTHGDPAAWEGTAVLHELVRVALGGGDPLAALPATLDEVPVAHRSPYATVLAPEWHPDRATEFNGAVWPCLGSAVWAVRTTSSYEDAVRAAVDLGGDTDTVAAVTGALAGAVYGVDGIPQRWLDALHVPLPGFGGRVLRAAELTELARWLAA